MNSYERLFARLEGKPVDKLPNLNIVMMFAAKQIGVPYSEYVTDYKKLVEGNLVCHEKFGIDCLCAISDPMREAEGFGCELELPYDDVPHAKVKLIQSIEDIKKLKVIDPSMGRRMNDRLEAVRLMKEKSAGQIPVIGWAEGAVAEACDLMDMSEFMMNLYDYEDEMHELLEICYRQSKLFALEQIKAGADIVGIGDAASSLLSPALYEEFALPYQQKLIQDIHDAGGKVKLHICGNIEPMLEHIAKVKADIVDVDHMVNINKAISALEGISSVSGNYDPVSVLLQGTPETIAKATRDCINLKSNTNIVAAGCEVPKMTPEENLLAVKTEIEK